MLSVNSEIADNNIDTYSSDTDLSIDKKFEESNEYIEDEEEASLDLVNLRNSDPDNIKIYFRSKKKISAKVIYDDDDMKLPLSNITVSGYIPLFQRNIERLLNFGETLVDTFSLPTEEEIAIRRPFHHYDKDTSFDSRQAAFCEINKKHQIFIDNYDNLYIYRLDAQKLKEKYKPSVSFAAVDIDDTASNESYSEANIDDTASNESYSEANIDDTASNESYSEANIDDTASNESYSEANIDTRKTGKYEYEIDHYRNAAANCLAFMLWRNYKNILPTQLSGYWAFQVFHKYRFGECRDTTNKINHSFFETLIENPGTNKTTQSLITIKSWINYSRPVYMEIKRGNPGKQREISIKEFDMMLNQISANELNKILKLLLISIEYYNSGIDQKYNDADPDFANRLDLKVIVSAIKSEKPQLRTPEFWLGSLSEEALSIKLGEEQSLITDPSNNCPSVAA